MNSTIRQSVAWSLFSRVATIRSNSFGNGLCNAIASAIDPESQVFRSSGFVKSTGIAYRAQVVFGYRHQKREELMRPCFRASHTIPGTTPVDR
jgi:hypothetical protein